LFHSCEKYKWENINFWWKFLRSFHLEYIVLKIYISIIDELNKKWMQNIHMTKKDMHFL
jgi:hypothetical protein